MLNRAQAAIVPDLPERSLERAGCPVCGEPLEIKTNGLTGEVTTRCPTCIARAERARFHGAYHRRALETIARDFGLTVEEAERRLRTLPVVVRDPALPRPVDAECERCHERFPIAKVGIIPRRCRRCSGRPARYGVRPKEISCERCGTIVTVDRMGIVPRFCAPCRIGGPKERAARPESVPCARCETPITVSRLGPIPTHCKPCQLVERADRMRRAAPIAQPPPHACEPAGSPPVSASPSFDSPVSRA